MNAKLLIDVKSVNNISKASLGSSLYLKLSVIFKNLTLKAIKSSKMTNDLSKSNSKILTLKKK